MSRAAPNARASVDALDHILWACDDLERGSQRFEALTGIRPRYGGVHASGLTHNALIALGGRRYLEILAPVGPPVPDEDAWCRMARTLREPKVLTYCVCSSLPLATIELQAASQGWSTAPVAGNGRTTPEGIALRWQWLGPRVPRFGLAFPFFIDWLDSAHPSATAAGADLANGVRLERFAVGHPEATPLRDALLDCGAAIETYAAPDVEFDVRLRTPRGIVAL